MPQLRPKDKLSLPVASFVAPSGRDETIFERENTGNCACHGGFRC
jgi:hypothetical protein